MFVEPGIEVNAIPHAPTAQAHARHPELIEQRDADPEIGGGLVLRQTPGRRQRQARVLHHCPLEARSYGFRDSPSLSLIAPVSTPSGIAEAGAFGASGGLSATL